MASAIVFCYLHISCLRKHATASEMNYIMSRNSSSITNIKDGIFNNLLLVTTQDVKKVYDIFTLKSEITSSGDSTNLQDQINSEPPTESQHFKQK